MKHLKLFESFKPIGTLVPQMVDILLDIEEEHGLKISKVKKLVTHIIPTHHKAIKSNNRIYYDVIISHPDYDDEYDVGGTFEWITIKGIITHLVNFMQDNGCSKVAIQYNIPGDGKLVEGVNEIPDNEIIESYIQLKFY